MVDEECLREIESLVIRRMRNRLSGILLKTRMVRLGAPGVESRAKAAAINSRRREKMESASRLPSALDCMGY